MEASNNSFDRPDWIEAQEAYYEAFGHYFPAEEHDGSIDEMLECMQTCLRAGKPYEPPKYYHGGIEIAY